MSDQWRTIEIHIVLAESGAFVVHEDASEAAEKADQEFPDEEMRQVTMVVELRPPSTSPGPLTFKTRLDERAASN